MRNRSTRLLDGRFILSVCVVGVLSGTGRLLNKLSACSADELNCNKLSSRCCTTLALFSLKAFHTCP